MEEESGTQTKADDLVHCEIDPFLKILTLTKFHPNLTHFLSDFENKMADFEIYNCQLKLTKIK